MTLLEEIEKYVQSADRRFDTEIEDNMLTCDTRENGDHYEEQYGEEDYAAANNLVQKLKSIWPDLEYEVCTCDEWVIIHISIKDEQEV